MNLTPRSILFLALIGMLGIVGAWADTGFLAAAWKFPGTVLALGLIVEWMVANRTWPTVSLVGEPTMKLGVADTLRLSFRNSTPRLLRVSFVPALPEGVRGRTETRHIEIPGRGELTVELRARGVELGEHPWARIPMQVSGPFRLANWSYRCPLDTDLEVKPDTLSGKRRRAVSSSLGALHQARTGAGIDLHHLRPYRKGDPRSTVDWKATARVGELITRIFSEDQHLEIIIALDAGRTSRLEFDGMSQLSHYINLAARFAEYAARAEDQAGLLVFSDRVHRMVKPQRGAPGVRRFRSSLASLDASSVESNFIEAALRIRYMTSKRSLIVILTDLYDRAAKSQLARCVGMLMPRHLPVIVGIKSADVTDVVGALAENWFDPFRAIAAKEYQNDMESNVARLRRMGAHALIARPGELDGSVFSLYESLRSRHRV